MTWLGQPIQPGSLLKKIGEKRPKNDAKRDRDEGHLAYIRKLPCLAGGKGPVEAAHIRMASAVHGKPVTGIGVKPDDRWCLPLSKAEHDKQHAQGEELYWAALKINPLQVALDLYSVSGDLKAGREIIKAARR